MPITRIQIRQSTYLTWSKDGVKPLDTAVEELQERSGELLRISSIVDFLLGDATYNVMKPPYSIPGIIKYLWPDRASELKKEDITPLKRTYTISLLTITEEDEVNAEV